MPFSGVVQPDQLKMLCGIHDEYCEVRNIADEPARKELAARILALFQGGAEDEESMRAA